jgi:hypothetical protein
MPCSSTIGHCPNETKVTVSFGDDRVNNFTPETQSSQVLGFVKEDQVAREMGGNFWEMCLVPVLTLGYIERIIKHA